jgi:hypothetical protein
MGTSLSLMVRENVSSLSGSGRSSKMGLPHFPHFGPALTLLASIRFHVSQNWQRTVSFFVAGLASGFVSVSIRTSGMARFQR